MKSDLNAAGDSLAHRHTWEEGKRGAAGKKGFYLEGVKDDNLLKVYTHMKL